MSGSRLCFSRSEGNFGRKHLSISTHQGCSLHAKIWTSVKVRHASRPRTRKIETLGRIHIEKTRVHTEKHSEGMPMIRKATVNLESCSICVPCIEVVHESGLSTGDLQNKRCTLSQLSITNSAEPGDPATRVCCENLFVGASLLLVMRREH